MPLRLSMLCPMLALFGLAGASNEGPKTFGKKSTAKEVQEALAPSLAGKTAIITGANSGIGLETAKALASAGCRVIACSRNVVAGREAITREMTSPGEGGYVVRAEDVENNVIVKQRAAASVKQRRGRSERRCSCAAAVPQLCCCCGLDGLPRLDLASLQSIEAFVDSLPPGDIDYLILNAGILATPTLKLTEDGFESQIGTNHFGHFHLADRLYARLLAQPSPVRVVTLSSLAHSWGDVQLDDLHWGVRKYSPLKAYGQSKLANILFAKGLQRKLKADGRSDSSVSVHPGVIKTPIWKHTPAKGGFLGWLSDRLLMDKTIAQGAASTVWAALSADVEAGTFISDCAVLKPKNKQATDEALVDGLWEATAQQIRQAKARVAATAAPSTGYIPEL
ncbi:hypothetical protein M885DRAFT_499403 [Pelagophyceae sp. CCMP2097]|nr:hypothetical protein M885DRAFT_499403 [Pelagophyceae sp. CCMP2097]